MRASFLLKYFLVVSDGFLVAIANAVGGGGESQHDDETEGWHPQPMAGRCD